MPDRVPTPARLLLVGRVLNGFGNGIFGVVFQLYMTSFGFDSSVLGTILMMTPITTLLFTIPIGVLSDRYGVKKILLFAMIPMVVQEALILTARTAEIFIIAFLVQGFLEATGVVFGPVYSSFFDSKNMDRAFGLVFFVNTICMSIGNLLGFIPNFLVSAYGFGLQTSYWIMMALGAVFFLLQMPFYIYASKDLITPKTEGGPRFNLRSKRVVAKFCFLQALGTTAYMSFFSLFPYYAYTKFSAGSDALGALFFASNFAQAGALIIAPRISMKLGTIKTIALAYGLCAPFWALFPLAPSFTWLSAIYVARLTIGNLATPLGSSLSMRLLHPDEKATANSLYSMSSMGGSILGPRLGGQLMKEVSLDLPAYLGAGIYAFLAPANYFLLRSEKEPSST